MEYHIIQTDNEFDIKADEFKIEGEFLYLYKLSDRPGSIGSKEPIKVAAFALKDFSAVYVNDEE